MDSPIVIILKAVDEAGWNDDTLIMMITNHCGVGKSHGGSSDQEGNVFLAVRGIGIEPNSKIESEVKLWSALL
ncbi:kinase-like protein [Gigaspora margarita]|uniref:Kinase-like protein n=1 Tax=Gigaspora margarita TaxID=4874 RepID=A0A8H4ELU3_GIGMA|nr:kinase-like protein [Gigaspora margarita]